MGAYNDQDLWAEVVAGEQRVARVRAEFYQHAEARREVLSAALEGSNWDRRAALSFLEVLPDDVPDVLDQLVENAMAPQWASAARRAIANGRPEVVTPALGSIVKKRLTGTDANEYRRLAELLDYLGDKRALAELVQKANSSDDVEIQEVGREFRARSIDV